MIYTASITSSIAAIGMACSCGICADKKAKKKNDPHPQVPGETDRRRIGGGARDDAGPGTCIPTRRVFILADQALGAGE